MAPSVDATFTGAEAHHVLVEHRNDVLVAAGEQRRHRDLRIALDLARAASHRQSCPGTMKLSWLSRWTSISMVRVLASSSPVMRVICRHLLALGIARVRNLGRIADVHERHVRLLQIGVDADLGVVGDRQHRHRAHVVGLRIADERARIGEARGHAAGKRRPHGLIRLVGRQHGDVVLRHRRVGLRLVQGDLGRVALLVEPSDARRDCAAC